MRRMILVVEDDRDNRCIFQTTLEHAGYEVTAVEDGLAALEAIGGRRPDLVVLDLDLPRLHGLEAARRIKARHDAPPIIAVTALALPGDEERARQAGCDDVLLKPCRAAELREKVGKWTRDS